LSRAIAAACDAAARRRRRDRRCSPISLPPRPLKTKPVNQPRNENSPKQPLTPKTQKQRWVAVVANAEFFVSDPQNESFAEVLRERVRYFGEQGRKRDFFFVPNPAWLDAQFPEQAKQVRRPCLALVSTDDRWMTFVKLRLDRVMRLELPADFSPEQALEAGAPLPELKMTGKWTAPYPAYAAGWHKAFYPPSAASHPF